VFTDTVLWALAGSPGTGIPSRVYWLPEKPLEITVIFGQSEEDYEADGINFIRWVFSRDLISQARAAGTAGVGDVQVKVRGNRLFLQLESPNGQVKLFTDAEAMLDFVRRTYQEVDQLTETDLLPLTDDQLREAMLDWGLM